MTVQMNKTAFDLKIEETEKEMKAYKLTDVDRLTLYGLYKQAKNGDCNPRNLPAIWDFVGRYKLRAWRMQKGKSKEAAEADYFAYLDSIKARP